MYGKASIEPHKLKETHMPTLQIALAASPWPPKVTGVSPLKSQGGEFLRSQVAGPLKSQDEMQRSCMGSLKPQEHGLNSKCWMNSL